MAGTAFGNAVEFMTRLGIFETVLPFLLVFTLMFAFLEKTRIFGTEQYLTNSDNKRITITRKNLNSMVSFTIAFFVVASTQLVAMISEITSKVILIVILVFSFTLVAGAFHKQTEEGFELSGTWKTVFEIIAFAGILVIFLDALGWLDILFEWLGGIWSSEATASIIMVLFLVGIMVYITGGFDFKKEKSAKKED